MRIEEFRKYPSTASKLFVIGYVLRIIPYVDIIGGVLTFIGWLKLDREWFRHTYLRVASLGSLLFVLARIIDLINGGLGLATPQIRVGSNISIGQLVQQLLAIIDTLIAQLTNPLAIAAPIILGTAIFMEIMGFTAIKRKTGSAVPGYIIILLILLGITAYMGVPAKIASAHGLQEYKRYLAGLRETGATPDLQVKILMKLVSAIMPLIAQSLVLFVLNVAVYALIAYKFHKFEEYRRESKILAGTSREEKGEEMII